MAKKKNNNYTADDIKVLSDREHVRLRTQVYLGNTSKTSYLVPFFTDGFKMREVEFVPAAYKAIGEIIDNCIDEFAQIDTATKHLKIDAQPVLGMYTVSDNGRGVPIDKHETGKYVPEVVFSQLRSGRNFGDDKQAGVIGQNGVGSACTNYCSTQFSLDIQRDGKRYKQTFTDGALESSTPSIRKSAGSKTGTTVNFQLDDQVFADVTLPDELMENRAIELALTNPGITVEYNKTKYRFKKGFDDIVKKLSNDYYKFENDDMEFYVIFDVHEGIDERVFSWVNSSLLFDGGLCNTQFMNAFNDKVVDHLSKEAKKNKCDVTKNDIRRNLLVLGNMKLSDPQYDAQSKTRLTGPNLRSEMVQLITNNWRSFARKNKDWLNVVLERAIERHHSSSNKKAVKDLKKSSVKSILGLVDATSKNRSECQLLVTEGDSAASMITDARDPKTIGSLPARGKFNNVYGSTVAQLVKMQKIADLLTAIGLVPGERAVRSNLRYGKVVIATDADVDGGDIFTLFINLFYQFWPELFDPDYPPFIYRLVAPNVCLTKGKNRKHFTSRSDYEKQKSKFKGWSTAYYKGLGSMERADWEMILSGETDTSIPIVDDGNIKKTLELLFSDDADRRKEWLQSNE